jgi:hypothetical protein
MRAGWIARSALRGRAVATNTSQNRALSNLVADARSDEPAVRFAALAIVELALAGRLSGVTTRTALFADTSIAVSAAATPSRTGTRRSRSRMVLAFVPVPS